ncbi:MAG: hypothetical protein KA383_05205 [Phycisphaerae bacterium]|nr:hypothetical protein [Phycisphaerae bacterium]
MSGIRDDFDHAEPGEPLTPIEATRLWATYCAGANPLAIVALDYLYRALRNARRRSCVCY